mgnify:CR=1 FL=1
MMVNGGYGQAVWYVCMSSNATIQSSVANIRRESEGAIKYVQENPGMS